MALSDCIKCWDTPCSCGWDYKEWSEEHLSKHIASIVSYRTKKQAKEIIKRASQLVGKPGLWTEKEKPKKP